MDTADRFKNELDELIRIEDDPAISVLIPAAKNAAASLQHPVRFRNLLREAKEQLSQEEFRAVESNWERAWRLVEDKNLWLHQEPGFATFFSPSHFKVLKLPYSVKEQLFISKRFLIRPLLPFAHEPKHAFVLTLSKHAARLFEVDPFEAREIRLEGIPPDGIDAILRNEVFETQLQVHSTGTPGMGGGAFHGNESAADREKENVREYLSIVSRSVHDRLGNEKDPLILAGVGYILAIYRRLNRYGWIHDEQIEGNLDHLITRDIHARAMPLLMKMEAREIERLLDRYGQLTPFARTSDDLNNVALSVIQGKVETLFVSKNAERWGEFDEANGRALEHRVRHEDDVELVDFIAAKALAQAAGVYALDPGKMPGSAPVAAVYRY